MGEPFTVIVPVKATGRGKSRLGLPDAVRGAVARAMAVDTVVAAALVAPVLVVAEDAADAAVFAALPGVRAHLTRVRGLNLSVLDGAAALRRPGAGDAPPGVAVLPADLPGLDAADLADALRRARQLDRAVVADRQGTGTTLLTGRRPDLLAPAYGEGSFARHVALGAVPLDVPAGVSIRMDVDEPADLDGHLGPRSRAALEAAGLLQHGRAGG
ncbi:2-phospho-L-lactate guanylyltransferase [Nakamurella endophytica]|nr:2-phospho-L-lactate guanylyltransferase [Nakamurella endophytica]